MRNNRVSKKACKNEACNEFYSGEITHININDMANNNVSLAKFMKFNLSSSMKITNNNNCMQFSINNEEGALPYLSNIKAPLQCFIGNDRIFNRREVVR